MRRDARGREASGPGVPCGHKAATVGAYTGSTGLKLVREQIAALKAANLQHTEKIVALTSADEEKTKRIASLSVLGVGSTSQ